MDDGCCCVNGRVGLGSICGTENEIGPLSGAFITTDPGLWLLKVSTLTEGAAAANRRGKGMPPAGKLFMLRTISGVVDCKTEELGGGFWCREGTVEGSRFSGKTEVV